MAKLSQFSNSVQITDGLSPKNGADFPLMEAHSIVVGYTDQDKEIRLDEKLESLEQAIENSGGGSGGDSNTNSGGVSIEGLDERINATLVNKALADYLNNKGSIETRLSSVETPLADYPTNKDSIATRLNALESKTIPTSLQDFNLNESLTYAVINQALSDYNADKSPIDTRLSTLENQLSDLTYKPIDITSFRCSVTSMREVGESLTGVTLSWGINKTPTEVLLDDKKMTASTSGTYTVNDTITSDKTWRLEAKDGTKSSDTAYASISFGMRVYYGVSTATEITEDFVESLSSELSSSGHSSLYITAEDQYIYYAHPQAYGKCEFWDRKTNGLAKYNFVETPTEITLTNNYGQKIPYYVYRSLHLANETADIEIR